VGLKEVEARDATALALLLAVMLALPSPLGYLAVFAAVVLYYKKITWAAFSPSHLAAALLLYTTTFLIDYATVGIPTQRPPWLAAVVFAPLAEELVFRALAFALLPTPLSWVFSVVIFGVLHLDNPLLAALYGAALSLAYRGGGYLASSALHAFNNALWLYLAQCLQGCA